MAAAPKKKYTKFKTPRGVYVYPKLHKAYKWDEASERSLPNPDGDYSTRLSVPSKEAQPLVSLIKQAIKESGVKPKHVPYEDEEKDGEKTGNVLFKLKAYGKTKDGEINRIKFFDADGTAIKGVVHVTGGSTGRLLGWISVSKMGCRLNIREAQIIDLAEMEGEGFEAAAGGSFKRTDLDNDNVTDDDEDEDTSTSNESGDNADDETNETEETSDEEEEF
ncbi:hypothetical protein [Bradyrhizobium sp. SZCCHNRI2049]|uniref:hypothetical protein n=1 Tax=Bradyrhizobium sp. SZCCHNRI2049 TaxID=3057287 RepID=UPI0029169419|nr:hypothetical protein [Bradyrhizobium sp. SZCCHNRI2049]